jgi:hypothetical protein
VKTILKSKWALAVAALTGASNVAAQSCPAASASACFNWKQDADRRQYQITYDVVAACDDEIITGANAWENAGSRFSTYHAGTYPDYTYNSAVRQEGYQIFWEPASQLGTTDTNAETRPGWGNGTTWRRPDGTYISMIMDADIAVNADRYAMGLIECGAAAPTSTQRDMARTMAHEFGHVVGMAHLTSTSCALYEKAQPGVVWTQLCSIETNGAKTLYGVR